jgi:hypothetical protein
MRDLVMDRKLIKTHKLFPHRKTDPISKPTKTKRGSAVRREEEPSPSLPSPERVEQVLR